MKRVLVIGSGGSGKTTFARRLAERTGLPLLHLDSLYWRPGWDPTPSADWRKRVEELVTGDAWIMDGNYGGTMDLRLAACDTVVFLDIPRIVCLWRVLKRQLLHRGRPRAELPPGCVERLSWDFVNWIWTYPARRRPAILRRLHELRAEQTVHMLGSTKEMEEFLADPKMRRRDFLASVSAAAGAVAWRLRPSAARVRFGYAAITWNGNDRQAIDDIAALGFRGIQLRQSAFDTWHERPNELKDLLSEKRLVFVALSSGNVSLDSVRDDEMIALHVGHARFLRDAGGRYLQIIDQRPQGRTPVADDYRRMGQLLTEIGRRTGDLGIPVAYHPHKGALGESPEEVARVLDAADPRFVHLLLDTAHYQQAGGDPAAAVRRYAGRLLFLHLKDLAGDKFVELGRGTVDFAALFAALDAIKFDGWGMVELDAVTDPAETPKESGAIARRYLERIRRWNDGS